ncbi:MAG: hypothetical protein WAZ20_06430, partial [Methanothrix sp.]
FIELDNRKEEARVHFIPDLKVGVFVTLCTPVVINEILKELSKELEIDLWTLDYLWWAMKSDQELTTIF